MEYCGPRGERKQGFARGRSCKGIWHYVGDEKGALLEFYYTKREQKALTKAVDWTIAFKLLQIKLAKVYRLLWLNR